MGDHACFQEVFVVVCFVDGYFEVVWEVDFAVLGENSLMCCWNCFQTVCYLDAGY